MSDAVNQCDGCRRGLPLDKGIHTGPGEWDMIGCTADRYGEPAGDTARGDAEPPDAIDPAAFADALGFTHQAEAIRAAASSPPADPEYKENSRDCPRCDENPDHCRCYDVPSPQPAGAEPNSAPCLLCGQQAIAICATCRADRPSPAPAVEEALRKLVARCDELQACFDDPTAMGYDGATTRTVWRQAIEAARALLTQTRGGDET